MRRVAVPPIESVTPARVKDVPVRVRREGRHAYRWPSPIAARSIWPQKVKAGFPGLSAEFDRSQVELGRYARAERLCAALDAADRFGPVLDMDSEFFRRQLLVAWGFWNREQKGYADVVFYHGFVDERTFVGLGGSAYHTMERAGDRMHQHSNSGLRALMAFLKERSEAAESQRSYWHGPPSSWYSEVWDADHDNPTVPEPVEFVAERLLDDVETSYGIRTIIGSPIYVARTGQPTTRRARKEYEALRDRHSLQIHGKRRLARGYIGGPSWPQPAPLRDPNQTDRASD